jgi:hypothetical protein
MSRLVGSNKDKAAPLLLSIMGRDITQDKINSTPAGK